MSGTPVAPPKREHDPVFRALFEHGALGVLELSVAGEVRAANAPLCQLLGVAEAKLLGRKASELCVASCRASVARQLSEAAAGGEGCVFEAELERREGGSCWGLQQVTPLRDEAGQVAGLLVCVLDVTERKRAEIATRFLADLAPRLALARDEQHIFGAFLQRLVEHLGVQGACVVETNPLEQRAVLSGRWPEQLGSRPPPSLALEQLAVAESWPELAGGTVVARESLATEAGGLVTLAVGCDGRALRHDEVVLVGELLHRVWPLIERARTEAALADEVTSALRAVEELLVQRHLMAGQAQALELMVKGAPLPEVLEALCDVIDQQATERRSACILLMQDDGRHLRPAAGRHMPVAWTQAVDPWPIGPNSGACGSAAYRRHSIVSVDIASDPLWSDELRALAARHRFRSCWSTPILSSAGAVLGTLALYYPSQHEPHDSEVQLVEVIARSAGIAIERQRGEEGIKTHSERLRLLWEAAAVLLTTEEPETLMRALFSGIAPHLELDVFLNHMQREAGELELFSFAGLSPQEAGEVQRIAPDSPLCGDVAKTHEPFAVSFIQNSREEKHPQLEALGLRAYACVPLTADERLIGTLAFGSRRRDHFEANELEFLRTVSIYVTVAYERLRLVRELREADRKKDDFIALLAHELRNPLAPLRNGLAVMKLASADSAAVVRSRAIMERQLSHMVRLIDDLLDVSRISLNKMQLRRTRVALSDIVSHALETARPTIDSAEHELAVLLPQEPLFLDADLTRLAQVFGNLLTNAAKYTPKRGQITLRAERQADEVVVAVEDNGIGLQPDSLQRIFGMFSQVDRSFERTTGGLGIGLALVKGLTEMHGGSVRAESAGPGQGSRFVVRLPALAEGVEDASPKSVQPGSVRPRRRILVADDNRDAVESMATMLRLSGNEVHVAHDGVEAVERAEAIKPDVVLMDVGMPRLNGYEATRRIRSQDWGQRMIVIALTGWGQESDRRKSREAGCNDHLVKPVDFGQLDELMGQLIRD
jgi:PAS domain S-box-containing protein